VPDGLNATETRQAPRRGMVTISRANRDRLRRARNCKPGSRRLRDVSTADKLVVLFLGAANTNVYTKLLVIIVNLLYSYI